MFQSYFNMMDFGGGSSLFLLAFPMMILLAVWGLVWKGIALWVAARRGEKVWFVALLRLVFLKFCIFSFFQNKRKVIL